MWFDPSPLPDKRVERFLARHGYTGCTIFYSPAEVSLIYILILSLMAYPILGGIWAYSNAVFWITIASIVIYAMISYFISVYYNVTIAFSENEVLFVNASWPFRMLEVCNNEHIVEIKRGHQKVRFHYLFVEGGNYVELKTPVLTRRYYCINIDEFDFDGNWTKKTIEELDAEIAKRFKKEVVINS